MPKLAIGETVWNAAFGSGKIVALDEQTATVFVPATRWEIKILPALLLPVFGPPPFVGPHDVEPSPEEEGQQEDGNANTETGSAATETPPAPKRRVRSRQLHRANN